MDKTKYPEDWKSITYNFKEAAGWKCQRCGHPNDPKAGYVLTTHHINSIKSDCREKNLVALCQRCHLRSQHYYEAIAAGQINLF